MTEHLTPADLDAMERGTLGLERVLSAAEHLRGCAECSARAEHAAGANRIPALRREIESGDSMHIVPEDLAAWRARTLPQERIAEIESHMAWCELCAQDLEDLEDLERLPAFESRKRPYRLAVAMAAMLAGAVLFVGLWRDRVAEPAMTVSEKPATPAPATATASPSPAREDSPPRAAARDYGRQDWTSAVARTLSEGRLEVSPAVAALSVPGSALRGGTTEGAARVLEPVGEVVEAQRPRFRWEPVEGAAYVVSVAARNREVARSERLSSASWRPSRPLERGITYSWQVEIISGDSSIVIPALQDPPAMFRLLDADSLSEIADARQRFPDDHLLLAVLYARHGMVSPAEAELSRFIERERPHNAASLLSSLRAHAH